MLCDADDDDHGDDTNHGFDGCVAGDDEQW